MTYTHGHHPSVLRSHNNRTIANSAQYLEPWLLPGQNVLDIGSGPGTITADIARTVHPGRVTAVEMTPDAAQLTAAELERDNIDTATTQVGDAHELSFPDDSFDVVHAHQLLQHVTDPVQALQEMARVCRPGGVVGVRDADYSSMAWYPEIAELDRWLELYIAAARANGGEPDAGRRLLSWAHAAGLNHVEPGSSTWCYATAETRRWWAEMWADRIVSSALAKQLVREEYATRDELDQISSGWRRWANEPAGWFSIQHGELLIRPE